MCAYDYISSDDSTKYSWLHHIVAYDVEGSFVNVDVISARTGKYTIGTENNLDKIEKHNEWYKAIYENLNI